MSRYQPKLLTHQIVNSTAGEAGTQAAQASLARDLDGPHLADGANPLGVNGANPLGEAGTQAVQASLARDLIGLDLAAGEDGASPLGVLAHLGASLARVARTEDGVDGVVLLLGVLNHLGEALRAASPNPQKDVTPHGAAHQLGAQHLGAHQDGTQASQARDLIGLMTHQDGTQASPARVHLTTGQHLATGKIHGHQLLLGMLLLGVVTVESLARAHPIGLDGVPSKKLKM
jgi:hypothetical protein